MKLEIFPDADEVALRAARWLAARAREAGRRAAASRSR